MHSAARMTPSPQPLGYSLSLASPAGGDPVSFSPSVLASTAASAPPGGTLRVASPALRSLVGVLVPSVLVESAMGRSRALRHYVFLQMPPLLAHTFALAVWARDVRGPIYCPYCSPALSETSSTWHYKTTLCAQSTSLSALSRST